MLEAPLISQLINLYPPEVCSKNPLKDHTTVPTSATPFSPSFFPYQNQPTEPNQSTSPTYVLIYAPTMLIIQDLADIAEQWE